MGYRSTVRGAILIHPPLTLEEYTGSPFLDDHASREFRCFRLHMEWAHSAEAPATGGPGIVATQLVGHEDEYKCYDADKDLAEFLAAFGEKHTFSDCLIRSGEEQGDLERYSFEDGELIIEKARLVWSDGPIENIEDVAQEDYEL